MTERDEAKAYRVKVIGLWFWPLAFFSGATWILMWRLPTASVCHFRDMWLLRALWFQNLTMFDQIKDLNYSTSQECVLFAVRSMLSLYTAVLAGVVVILARTVTDVPKAGWSGMIAVSALMLIFLVFWDGFDDQFHGYRGWLSYRTYDSINTLIGKSLLRMVAAYGLVVAWAFQAISVWHRNAARSDRQRIP